MIFNQSLYSYLLAWSFLGLIIFRLHSYFSEFFDKEFAWLVPLAIVLHPLSLDAFLAPNVISGGLAFWLFLESQFFLKQKKSLYAFLMIVLAGFCNFSFSFLSVYFFWKQREDLKKYKFPFAIYLFFLCLYLYKHLLSTPHNPFTFIVYFLQTLILPMLLTIFNYSLFPFPWISLLVVLVVLGIFLWKQKKDNRSKEYWPILILPALSVLFQHWNGEYKFWHEILFTPSSYLCITFAFVTILAIHVPRYIFYTYFLILIIISVSWSRSWFPLSNLLEVSISDLPEHFEQTKYAKKILALQYSYEGDNNAAKAVIKELANTYPQDSELQQDYKTLFQTENQNKK